MQHLTQDFREPQVVHDLETVTGHRALKDVLGQDLADGVPRHGLQLRSVALNAGLHVGFDVEEVLGHELDGTKHPCGVVRERLVGVYRSAKLASLQVSPTHAKQVKHRGILRAVRQVGETPEQSIERELTSK